LIEVLTAIAIVAVITATTVPSFMRAVASARFNASVREVFNALKTARHEARQGRRETTLTLDTEAITYVVDGNERRLSVPEGAMLALVTAESEIVDSDAGAIRFFPDGSSTGGTVTIAYQDRSASIDVDWLTGRVTYAR
jgi:general secretion pathway protein H